MKLTERLRSDYGCLFDTCIIRANRTAEVESIIGAMVSNLARYQQVAGMVEIPWFVIAVIHLMEASLRFDRHLHNGDPLTERTTQVPPGSSPHGYTALYLGGERHGCPPIGADGPLVRLECYGGPLQAGRI